MSGVIIAIESIILGLTNKDARYRIIDEEHLIDDQTDFEFFLYPDSFKVTKDGELVATSNDFMLNDRPVFLKLKEELSRQYAPIKAERMQNFLAPYKPTM